MEVLGRDEVYYRRFLSGDTSAYDELMIRHGDSITAYLYGYLHDWHDAEDLMIEAFARIMVKRPAIRDGGFKPYIFKTARRLAARFAAKKKRMQCFSLDEHAEEYPDNFRAEYELLNEEKKAALHLCLERIDPEFREALWLVYMEDMTYAAAADVMGVSKKKIDNLLSRGKLSMRKELEKEGILHAYG